MISEVVGTLLNVYSEHFSSFCGLYLILIRQPTNKDWQLWDKSLVKPKDWLFITSSTDFCLSAKNNSHFTVWKDCMNKFTNYQSEIVIIVSPFSETSCKETKACQSRWRWFGFGRVLRHFSRRLVPVFEGFAFRPADRSKSNKFDRYKLR